MSLFYIQASAGSGKTTSIENDVVSKLKQGVIQANQIMAVTFTTDAAAELKSRISKKLFEEGLPAQAFEFMSSRVGTVHAVLGKLLNDFAFELGMSPEQKVIDEVDQKQLLHEALDSIMQSKEMSAINDLASKLCIEDWQKNVLSIIELVRTNRFDLNLIDSFSKDSIRFLSQQLPKPDSNISSVKFKELLKNTVREAALVIKPTQGLKKSVEDCEEILRKPFITWQGWLKVSKLNPTKCGESIFMASISMGADVLKCEEFQQDMYNFIRYIMSAVKSVMREFSDIKKRRGLVDFIDQEVLALEALELPVIQERLQNEIRYLIVDEFQDTSPIQLAVFSKLSSLVNDVLLVGDAKQAIYGFRGSDPRLSLDVLNYIQRGNGDISSLSYSWRSRPGLVSFVNELFTHPFSHLLTPDQVQLKAKRDHDLSSAELSFWMMDDSIKNNLQRFGALAAKIHTHVRSGIEIWCKQSNQKRKATWKDVAVLFRYNDEVATFATCCAQAGIPVAVERVGLLETPEISLALACLRVLIDPYDSLACAEILTLATGAGPESWISHRLDAVTNNQAQKWDCETHLILKKLVELRQYIKQMSIKEALEIAMISADVTGIVTHWEETTKLTEHRIANLSKLIALVDDYEAHCSAQFFATTITGFILWLKEKERQMADKQAENIGNAITISTYHSAKGLEWPIVICASLNTQLKVSLFGSHITETNSEFDWNNPLAGRALTYYPNPFPDHKKNPLVDIFSTTKNWAEAEKQAKNEAIQLLYVGMTRARDQLILCCSKTTEWLDLLECKHFPLSSNKLLLNSDEKVDVDIQNVVLANEMVNFENKRVRSWLMPITPAEGVNPILYFAPPSLASPISGTTCKTLHDFNSRIPINNISDMDQFGTVLHQCLALIISNDTKLEQQNIENLLGNEFTGKINADDIIRQVHLLMRWINVNYPGSHIHTEFPFSRNLANGSLQQGSIDLLLETDAGWVVIDHKSNPQPKKEWEMIAAKHSGQLHSYKEMLTVLSDKPVLSTLIHFSVSGGLVELNFP